VKNIEFKISRMAGESIVRPRWKILGHQVPSGALWVIMGIQFQSAVDP